MIYIIDKNNIKIEFKNIWYNKQEKVIRKDVILWQKLF